MDDLDELKTFRKKIDHVLRGPSDVLIEIRLFPNGASLRARPTLSSPEYFPIEVTILVRGRNPGLFVSAKSLRRDVSWIMSRESFPSFANIFSDLMEEISWISYGREIIFSARAHRPGRSREEDEIARLNDHLSEMNDHLLACAHPEALRIAQTFDRATRFRVYAKVFGDRTGRLLQSARSMPSFLKIMIALEDRDCLDIAADIERLILDGQKPRRILDAIFERWLRAPGLARTEIYPRYRMIWRAMAELPRETIQEMKDRHLLLLKKACACVPGELLLFPPPVRLIPEDIPHYPSKNLQWFQTMRHSELLFLPSEGPIGDCARTLAPVLSKNFAAITRGREQIQNILAFMNATGVQPTRATNFARLLNDAEAWRHAAHHEVDRPPTLVTYDPDDRFPFTFESEFSEEFQIRPLRTSAELEAEGFEMGNCIGNYVSIGMRESVVFAHARINAEPVTIFATLKENECNDKISLALLEAKRFRNRPCTPEEISRLEAWARQAKFIRVTVRNALRRF